MFLGWIFTILLQPLELGNSVTEAPFPVSRSCDCMDAGGSATAPALLSAITSCSRNLRPNAVKLSRSWWACRTMSGLTTCSTLPSTGRTEQVLT